MWIDEVRLHLTETFQEEVGLSQSNLSYHLSSVTPNLLIGKTQKLKDILTYQPMQGLYQSPSLLQVKHCLAPAKPSTNRATPGWQVRISRLLSRHSGMFGCQNCLFFSSRPFLCSGLFFLSPGTHPESHFVSKHTRICWSHPRSLLAWITTREGRPGVGGKVVSPGAIQVDEGHASISPTENAVNGYHSPCSKQNSSLECCNS